MGTDHASGQYAQPHACLPGRQHGGIGRTSLGIVRQIHEHTLKSWVHVPVPQTDDEWGQVERPLGAHCGEQEVAHDRCQYALGRIFADFVLLQSLSPGQSGNHQAYREKQEPESGAGRDAQLFLTVDGHVGGHDAIAKREAHNVHRLSRAFHQEEPVERNHFLFGSAAIAPFHFYGGVHDQCDQRHYHREEKQHLIVPAGSLEHEYGGKRAKRGGEVVTQSEVADALRASRRGEHVYGYGIRGYYRRPERSAVNGAEDGEYGERPRRYVTCEQGEEHEVTQQEYGFPGETVHYVAAERAYQYYHNGIAGQNDAYGIVIRSESFT